MWLGAIDENGGLHSHGRVTSANTVIMNFREDIKKYEPLKEVTRFSINFSFDEEVPTATLTYASKEYTATILQSTIDSKGLTKIHITDLICIS